MSDPDHDAREALRDRFLEFSLEEVLAEDAEKTEFLDVEEPRRPTRWLAAVAAALLAVAILPLLLSDSGDPASDGPVEFTGRVLLPDGEPAAKAKVRLELGWTDKDLPPPLPYLSVKHMDAETDELGRYSFEDLPAGSTGVVYAYREKHVGSARVGSGVDVTLAPLGAITGRVVAHGSIRRRVRVQFYSPTWTAIPFHLMQLGFLNDEDRFEVKNLPPGPGKLVVTLGNWPILELPFTVQPGRTVEVPVIEFQGEPPFLPQPGSGTPIDADRVRLVDAEGRAMPGVGMGFSNCGCMWSTRSDENGEVKLEGGGAYPPFLLGLRGLGGPAHFSKEAEEPPRYSGRLMSIRDGVALVRVTPLRLIEGRVSRGESAVGPYVVLFETADEVRRVYGPLHCEGKYSIWLPPGKGTWLVLTVDGRVHRVPFEVPAGDGPLSHDIELPR